MTWLHTRTLGPANSKLAVHMSFSSKDKQLLGTGPSAVAKVAHACAASRLVLKTAWHANQRDQTAISLALDDCLEVDSTLFTDAELSAAIKHVSQCTACLQWRKSELEPERYEWIKGSQAYCCTEMFDAVHGAKAGFAMRYGLMGPENQPCWWVEPSSTVIRYCPWCGSSLAHCPPDAPAATGAA